MKVFDQFEATLLSQEGKISRIMCKSEKYTISFDVHANYFSCKTGDKVSICWVSDEEEYTPDDDVEYLMNGQVFYYDNGANFACITFGGLVMKIEGNEEDMVPFSKKKIYLTCYLKNEDN